MSSSVFNLKTEVKDLLKLSLEIFHWIIIDYGESSAAFSHYSKTAQHICHVN